MQLCGQFGHPALAVKVSFSVSSFFIAGDYSPLSSLLLSFLRNFPSDEEQGAR